MEVRQPEGYPRCFMFERTFRRGKSKNAKVYREKIMLEAELTAPLDRYRSGMTTLGHYHQYSHTDPIGARCHVYGFKTDGMAIVALPGGGYGELPQSQVRITQPWPAEIAAEEKALYEAMQTSMSES